LREVLLRYKENVQIAMSVMNARRINKENGLLRVVYALLHPSLLVALLLLPLFKFQFLPLPL
jgi:hypothetical protein